MAESTDDATTIEAALLEGANIAHVIELELMNEEDGGLIVCARVDIPAERTMREVSTILYQAKRRVTEAVPAAHTVYLEPDVWVDPDTAQPTTSAVVMLGLD
ncbi:MAG: hypothetical protein D3X82_14675 [Candidatus Leucobacter sulfamidivorax]|jgi:hypothetical protein|nr:hypothetical protein [Candidatus Leucobacter sulfamidivorax]